MSAGFHTGGGVPNFVPKICRLEELEAVQEKKTPAACGPSTGSAAHKMDECSFDIYILLLLDTGISD